MGCKNWCERFGIRASGRAMPYSNGLKFCTTCYVYLDSDGVICLCCGRRLRCNGRFARAIRAKKVKRY